MQVSIQDRTKSFAIRIIKACSWLDETPGIKRTLGKQLLRSGTSIDKKLQVISYKLQVNKIKTCDF